METLTPAGMKLFGKAYQEWLYDHDFSTNLETGFAEEVAILFANVFDAEDQVVIAKVDTCAN